MKTTFLLLASLITAHIHSAQNTVLIPSTTEVTAVFINNKNAQELFRLKNISYTDLTRVMNVFIRETGYIAEAADLFDAKTNFIFLIARLGIDGPIENNTNAISAAVDLFCTERGKRGIPLPNPSELVLIMRPHQIYQMVAYSQRR